jgi:hypothetical protein
MANGTLAASQIEMESLSGTGVITITPPATNTNRAITLPDAAGEVVLNSATQTLTNKTIQGGAITSGTVNAGGTNPFPSAGGPLVVDFTGIPSWVKRITVMFSGVSTSGTSNILIQIGSGSFTTSGYVSQVQQGTSSATSTAGFIVTQSILATANLLGSSMISLVGGTTYVASGNITSGGAVFNSAGGSPSLSGALDRVRITTVNGTDTFDAGSINILYEG